MYARFGGARQAGTRRQRGPSVAVRGKADGVHRPSAQPGRRPLYVRGHRDASTHGDTPRYRAWQEGNGPRDAFPQPGAVSTGGGRCWVRTNV